MTKSTLLHLSDPILEREAELGVLADVLAAGASGNGDTIIVEGPAGIGKSRLLSEARMEAERQGMEVLTAAGGELEQQYPAGVALNLFQPILAARDRRDQESVLRGPARAAAPLFVLHGSAAPAPATGEEFALVHGLFWLVVNLAEQAPVALVVDDVHWADTFSLRFLIYLAHRLSGLPVSLILAARLGDPGPSDDLVSRLYEASNLSPVRPSSLSAEAVQNLIARADEDASQRDDVVAATWQNTGGNAFLVHELIASARDHPRGWQAIVDDPQSYTPASVARNVMLRLRRHGTAALALARSAAILGENASLVSVSKLAGVDGSEAFTVTQRLLGSQIFAEVDPVVFSHPMVRRAVLSELPVDQKPELHKAAAALLHERNASPDAVAQQLLAAPPSTDSWVTGALRDGARLAAQRGSPQSATRYLRRALEISPTGEVSSQVLIELAQVEAAAGEPTSITRFIDALDTVKEPSRRREPLYALGQTLFRRGRHSEAAEVFREGAELCSSADRFHALQFESAGATCAHYLPALRPEALRRLESIATEIVGRKPADVSERAVLGILALYRAASVPRSESAALAEMALAGGALAHEETFGSIEAHHAMLALIWCGRPQDALPHVELVLSEARKRGDVLAFADGSYVRALVMYRLGHVTDALADAEASVDAAERGWGSTSPGPHGLLAACLMERDDLAGAEQAVRATGRLADGSQARGSQAWLLRARGRLALRRNDTAGALEDLLESGRVLESNGFRSPGVLAWRSDAATAATALDDASLARELIDEELHLAAEFELQVPAAMALRVRALTQSYGDAVETLEQAGSILDDRSALELSRLLLDLGGRRRRAGHRVDARVDLRRALDIAHRCGGLALAKQAHEELLAAGARPRRAQVSGVEALTPSEERIARLATEGLNNRRIAETLFLTKNTIEWHLRNVYRKLGISSRHELTDAMHQPGLEVDVDADTDASIHAVLVATPGSP